MGLVVKLVKAGERHPPGPGVYADSYTEEEAKAYFRNAWNVTSKVLNSKTKEQFLGYVTPAGRKLDKDAWILTWEDEPEENEFGRICP